MAPRHGRLRRDRRADLYAINTNDGGTVAVHVLSAASNFQQFILQTKTALHATDSGVWRFAFGDEDRDGRTDVYAINTNDGGTTAVHVVDGGDFTRYSLQVRTALHATDSSWRFAFGDEDADGRTDLYAICANDAGTTAIHGLSARSNYQQFLIQTRTGIHATDNPVWRLGTGVGSLT